jgi:hypothetical protein
VPVKVGYFCVFGDFIVVDMKENPQVLIILGCPFLRTTGAMINVRNENIILNVGDEKVEFDMHNSMKYSPSIDTCFRVEITYDFVKDVIDEYISSDPSTTQLEITFETEAIRKNTHCHSLLAMRDT